jgi:hypothetical protein
MSESAAKQREDALRNYCPRLMVRQTRYDSPA